MDIKELKKELGISNKDLAECFNMTYGAYSNSTAKKRYENALLNFYKLAKKGCKKIK
jgi:transcriptional regulator with XRE-family HTH domain